MKITTILKDIFLALASTLLFGGGIGFLGVWIFDARISTMIHISVYIFLLMLAMWLFIDYEDYTRALRLMKQINTARSLCFI